MMDITICERRECYYLATYRVERAASGTSLRTVDLCAQHLGEEEQRDMVTRVTPLTITAEMLFPLLALLLQEAGDREFTVSDLVTMMGVDKAQIGVCMAIADALKMLVACGKAIYTPTAGDIHVRAILPPITAKP